MGTSARTRNILINLALAAGSLLLAAAGAEVALRVALTRNLNPFQRDAVLSYRMRENFGGVYPRVWVQTDAFGHRIPADQGQDATGKLLFVGDSVIFGFGVRAEESFGLQLAAIRGRADDGTLAAVPGYNLDQVLVLLEREARRVRPEWILYGLVINDIGNAHVPGSYENIDPQAAREGQGGFLSHSYLIAFMQRRWLRVQARMFPEEVDRSDLNRASDGELVLQEGAVPAFDDQWARLEDAATALGVPVFVLICPYSQQVTGSEDDTFQRFVLERCQDGPLMCLDPLPLFREHRDEELFTPGSSYHYTPLGHRLLAEWLDARLPGRE